MAYIEAFFYYIVVTLVMFIVLSIIGTTIYWVYRKVKSLIKSEAVSIDFKSIVKSRIFKMIALGYFTASAVFYINESVNYYGKDRAYPKAKAYAITADTVWFWQSMMVNIKLNRGWGEFNRLLRPEDMLDTQIQRFQTFLLNKMYRYIPEDDAERDYWYHKYKQYYMAQIRYAPGSIHQPTERIIAIMDDMHKTSHALYEKNVKDKVIDKRRYLAIAQMSVYLAQNTGYFTPFEKISYLSRLFKLMDNRELFQKSIKYKKLLSSVYKKMKSDKDIAELFDNDPYRKGFLYAALTKLKSNQIVYDAHNNIEPCSSKELTEFVGIVQDFYAWIFKEKDSSFKKLSQREQKQIKWLYNYSLYFSYQISRYICKIPYKYKDDKYLPVYKNSQEFFDEAVTVREFVEFTHMQKRLEEIKNKEK